MPQPAMRDPGGGLWVVGSEGRLGAGQSVCVRAHSKSPTSEGARRPCAGAANSGCFWFGPFLQLFPLPSSRFGKESVFLSEPEGRLGTTESLPAPPPRLCLQMRKQTRQTGKSHMKSRRCAASSDSASSAPSVPRLCLSSAFQPRPASLAVGGIWLRKAVLHTWDSHPAHPSGVTPALSHQGQACLCVVIRNTERVDALTTRVSPGRRVSVLGCPLVVGDTGA